MAERLRPGGVPLLRIILPQFGDSDGSRAERPAVTDCPEAYAGLGSQRKREKKINRP
jgi:hypothetical protein